jgi:tetratricopeptide (TPR) repeat protein
VSGRRRLLRKTLILCSVPVLVAAGFVSWRETRGDEPYVAGRETEGITRVLDRSGAQESGLRFTEVTEESGIDFVHFPFRRTSQLPEDMGPGAAWGDYDGDGDFDVYLANFSAPLDASDAEIAASAATGKLFRNRGDGTFEDVTAAAGVGKPHRGLGAAWGDVDADGDLDLFVSAWGHPVLWRNAGDGTFTDVTAAAGLRGEGFWTGAAFSDYDVDGDLDLYVCGYVQYDPVDPKEIEALAGESDFPFTLNPSSHPPHPNRLFVNRGDGTFVDGADAAGVANPTGKSLCGAFADLDANGRPDLYVANDVSDNALYVNAGDGTFLDKSYEAVVADYRGAMGLAIGDWDGDLDLDIFITHWIAQENALYSNQLTAAPPGAGLLFADEADMVGLGQISLDLIGWGTDFVDFDNDGKLDLFVSNGSTFQMREDPSRLVQMQPHVYWNRGVEQGYFEVGEKAGVQLADPGVGRGAAFCDYDADGDVDVLLCRHGGRPRLLRNDTTGGHSITLRLRGRSGHPSGWGARVLVHAGGTTFLREATPSPSYLSQGASDLVVGLGSASRVDSVEVRWPLGKQEVVRDLAAGQLWILEEGAPPRSGPPYRGKADVAVSAAPLGRAEGENEYAILAQAKRHLSPDETRLFWDLRREVARRIRAQEWEEAVTTLDRMLAIDPHHEDALYERGNCLLELARYAEAKASWEELLRVNPGSTRAWTQIGALHALPDAGELFDLEKACTILADAFKVNPEQSGALILWGEAAVARGDLVEAERVLASAYRLNPQATSALLLGGYVAWKRGDRRTAEELLQRAASSAATEPAPSPVVQEGETRSELDAIRRRASERRLFASCVDSLRAFGGNPDPERIFPLVDAERRSVPKS